MFSTFPLDHVGIAVESLDAAIPLFAGVPQNTVGVVSHRERLLSQGVELCFLNLPNTKIELLAPLPGVASKLAQFLAKRGSGIHHLCYRVPNIAAELARLSAAGYELIDATPRPGAHNSKIAFVHPRSCGGVLTELCEY